MKKIFKVDNDYRRLDDFLVINLSLNKSQVNKLIKNKLVAINGQITTKNGASIYSGDIIELLESHKNDEIKLEPFEMQLDVKFEDDDIIILYKPSGILTHATTFNEKQTILNALLFYSKSKWEPFLVHRLDKDTSGLIIFAKNKKAQELMLKKFQDRSIVKKYYAIVNQPFNSNHFLIDVPISRSSDNKMKMVAGNFKNAKEALTEVFVIENWKKFALVDVLLHTGRTHQIRVHLKYINHPIFNDPLYSYNRSDNKYGQYLMAYYLEFNHPINDEQIKIEIKMDSQFIDLIENIKNQI